MSSEAATPENVAVVVRHAPQLNGRIEGSIQQNLAEAPTLNSGAVVTHEFLVPGTPSVWVDPNGSLGSTVQDNGAAQPLGYQVRVSGGVSLAFLRTRVDAQTIPVVTAPPMPQGTRYVNLNTATDPVGDWATVRNLQINMQTGMVSVPPGTYGDLTVNGPAAL